MDKHLAARLSQVDSGRDQLEQQKTAQDQRRKEAIAAAQAEMKEAEDYFSRGIDTGGRVDLGCVASRSPDGILSLKITCASKRMMPAPMVTSISIEAATDQINCTVSKPIAPLSRERVGVYSGSFPIGTALPLEEIWKAMVNNLDF